MTDEKEWTMPVPKAGKKYYGLGRNASYRAAAKGQIPVMKIGKRWRASVPAIEAQLAGVKATAS